MGALSHSGGRVAHLLRFAKPFVAIERGKVMSVQDIYGH